MPTYIRLTDYKSSEAKERGFFKPENRYEARQEDFEKIPGSPIAYWVSDKIINLFNKEEKISDIGEPKTGLVAGNNELHIKNWYEVPINSIGFNYKSTSHTKNSPHKWFPLNHGGDRKKWYGSFMDVVNYQNNASEISKLSNSMLRNEVKYFKKGISWNRVSAGNFVCKYVPDGFIFDDVSPTLFTKKVLYILSLLNSKVGKNFEQIINSGFKTEVGHIAKIPVKFTDKLKTKQELNNLAQQNIDISKEEWDSRETSWDFRINELIRVKNEELRVKNCKIEDTYNAYCDYWREKFFQLHANEEELNRLFIDIYELQDELTPDVPLEDITILKNEAKIIDGELVFQADEIMKQLISYGVGVMFGRYSLDHEGLHIADMGVSLEDADAKFDITHPTFEADDDNIIPVLEDDYFKDDIASRFVQFVKAAFGEEHLRENIKFIEDSLGTTLRKYFVKGFYEDHIKRYKKRPIYWMVASPKKGFMSLLYMHRYQSDVFARVRNSYLSEYIAKLEAHKETLHLTVISETASNKDKKDADKKIKSIEAKLKEVIAFDREKMMSVSQNPIEIDLDDGVKVNYCKFKDILYPITGLCKK